MAFVREAHYGVVMIYDAVQSIFNIPIILLLISVALAAARHSGELCGLILFARHLAARWYVGALKLQLNTN